MTEDKFRELVDKMANDVQNLFEGNPTSVCAATIVALLPAVIINLKDEDNIMEVTKTIIDMNNEIRGAVIEGELKNVCH